MKRLTSTQILAAGFAAILGVLACSAVEAFQSQRAGGAQYQDAYDRFIQQDNAVTEARRAVWLGGIYSRDYFLNQTPAGRTLFSHHLAELRQETVDALARLRESSPARFQASEIDAAFQRYLDELGQLEKSYPEGRISPEKYLERVLVPQRLNLLGRMEDFRASVRQDFVDAENQFDLRRAAAARNLLILLTGAFIFGLIAAGASLRYAVHLEAERLRQFEALALANQELENLSAHVLEIQESERSALSRELHDEVGQALTALRMEISQAIGKVKDDSVRDRLLRARELTERTVGVVRDISLMLRPSLLDDLGLGPALQWQLAQFSDRSGIRHVFHGADVGEDLPDEVKTCVFRIAQEALNNCEKYAHASELRVVLQERAGNVSLEVQDNGEGFLTDRRGLPFRGTGILGMKERAQKLGGTVSIASHPGAGTTVTLLLPVHAPVLAGPMEWKERV